MNTETKTDIIDDMKPTIRISLVLSAITFAAALASSIIQKELRAAEAPAASPAAVDSLGVVQTILETNWTAVADVFIQSRSGRAADDIVELRDMTLHYETVTRTRIVDVIFEGSTNRLVLAKEIVSIDNSRPRFMLKNPRTGEDPRTEVTDVFRKVLPKALREKAVDRAVLPPEE